MILICSLIFQGKGEIETYWLLGRNIPNALEADVEPMMDTDEVVATAMPSIIMWNQERKINKFKNIMTTMR